MASWLTPWTWWAAEDKKPVRATDASHDPAVRRHFTQLLDHNEPPASFSPGQVAKALSPAELKNLGYDSWVEVLPAVMELAFEQRDFGDCEIVFLGKKTGKWRTLGEDKGPEDLGNRQWRIMRKVG